MEFWNDLWVAVQPAVITLVTALVGYLVTKAAAWLGAKAAEAKENIKSDIARQAVQWVEQKAKSALSNEKFTMAANKASELLAGKGIQIDATELEVLIESAVNSFNNEYWVHDKIEDASAATEE